MSSVTTKSLVKRRPRKIDALVAFAGRKVTRRELARWQRRLSFVEILIELTRLKALKN